MTSIGFLHTLNLTKVFSPAVNLMHLVYTDAEIYAFRKCEFWWIFQNKNAESFFEVWIVQKLFFFTVLSISTLFILRSAWSFPLPQIVLSAQLKRNTGRNSNAQCCIQVLSLEKKIWHYIHVFKFVSVSWNVYIKVISEIALESYL